MMIRATLSFSRSNSLVGNLRGNSIHCSLSTGLLKKPLIISTRSFSDQATTTAAQPAAQKIRAVVFQPDVQTKVKKRPDPFSETVPTIPSIRLKEAVVLAEALNFEVALSDVIQLKQFYRGSFFGKVKLEENQTDCRK